MKRIASAICMFLMVMSAMSQGVTVSFTARSTNGSYHRFDTVRVENLSHGWNQSLVWPDTILTLGSSQGIGGTIEKQESGLKVYPNPFEGRTEALFQLAESGTVQMRVLRINGTIISEYSRNMTAGQYRIGITLSDPQVAFFSIEANGQRFMAKLINQARGNKNDIEIVSGGQLPGTKAVGAGSFSLGDMMRYKAVSMQGGVRVESAQIVQSQASSEQVCLVFSESTTTLPTVLTSSVSNITGRTATCGGTVTNSGNTPINARGVCWSTDHNPSISDNHTADGSGTGAFSSSISGLEPSTIYYVRAYATNSVGTAYGSEEMFITDVDAVLAVVVTSAVTDISPNSATCGGNVNYDGNAAVTSRGVCWSTNHNPTVSGSHTTNGSGIGGFSSNMTGLTPSTVYYVRAYAINSVGTSYGEEVMFTSASETSIATLTTSMVSEITAVSAICGGTITNDGNSTVTSRGICWSTSPNPTVFGEHTTDGSGMGTFSSSIGELMPSTIYYVRAYAINGIGTAYGNEVSFTTDNPVLPTVATSTISDITPISAICGGLVSHDGYASVTSRGVCWSTTPNPTVLDSKTIDGSGIGGFTSNLIDVVPSTNYYVRAYATNSVGTAYGNEVVFTTEDPFLPSVATLTVNTITARSANCGGVVNDDGYADVTERGVCWGTSHNPTTSDSHTVDGVGTGEFSSNIEGLDQSTTYYVRAYATNVSGTAYGNEETFTTQTMVLPTVSTSIVENVTSNGANCGGTVLDDGYSDILSRGVCWSTSHNPTISDSHTSDGIGIGVFSSNISDLSSGTTYFIRAYATNTIGTSYGEELAFRTESVIMPTIVTLDASNVSAISATVGGTVLDSGDASVTVRGVCWSIDHNPDLSDSHISNGSGVGTFNSVISQLTPSIVYYVRAYAVNSVGTAYGNEVSFTTDNPVLPTVTTAEVTDVIRRNATCGGTISHDGYADVTARGVCWGTEHNPTLSDNHTSDGMGTGSFTSNIVGMNYSTTYYFRAYATNSVGTAYGNEVEFTMGDLLSGFNEDGASLATFSVADGRPVRLSRGNLQYQASTNTWRFAKKQYNFVGASNSNVSDTNSGWIDLFGWGTSGWNSGAEAYQPWSVGGEAGNYGVGENCLTGEYANADWGVYNSISNGGNQGGLWRTWSKSEIDYMLFTRITSTVGSTENGRFAKANVSGVNGLIIFPDNYTHPSEIPVPTNVNLTGSNFSSNTYTTNQWAYMESEGCVFLPAAGYRTGEGIVRNANSTGYYWTSTNYGATGARILYFVGLSTDSRNTGKSVRLIQDVLPVVTTSIENTVTANSAICGGNVTCRGVGDTMVVARGICWSTRHNPTIQDNHTTDGAGTGEFTSNISGLLPGTLYYIRAYATNSAGVAYGEEVAISTSFDEIGASVATFSVSADRQVRLSRGNLQYHASTNTWRFAEKQYDYVGLDNENISDTNSGWIDLFGWGTSGWNSGAEYYQPWSVGGDGVNYGVGTNNLTGGYTNADWGMYNSISNGGNHVGLWRTWTKSEIEYLLFTRMASTVGGTENGRFVKANISGINGLIIFPDSYIHPSDVASPTNVNLTSASFSSNTYTVNQWEQIEAKGCVFLPQTYRRNNEGVLSQWTGSGGYYWTSSSSGNDYAFFLAGTSIETSSRTYGHSVRLIHDYMPLVTTAIVGDVTTNSVTCGGRVVCSGDAPITACGVCWSTHNNPTISDSHTNDGTNVGNFISNISGLLQNTTYYLRAYATNSYGTTYGNEEVFTTDYSVMGFDSNGASLAVFSVADNRQIRFSRGNLQYQASTNTWRFAEKQYGYVGSDNVNISATNTGWIDLFGWGTSGWNSGANAYQPWSTSEASADYYPGGEYSNSLIGSFSNADWGVYNAIANGGNQAGVWRTMTREEWVYLVSTRSASTVGDTANARFVKATVAGVGGLIIFPDNYNHPLNVPTPTQVNDKKCYYSSNVYTIGNWIEMEASGCIFLPAAGRRKEGCTLQEVGGEGHYWTSTYANSNKSYYMLMWRTNLYFGYQSADRNHGLSVRLVTDL